jgi:hypothetical protein
MEKSKSKRERRRVKQTSSLMEAESKSGLLNQRHVPRMESHLPDIDLLPKSRCDD